MAQAPTTWIPTGPPHSFAATRARDAEPWTDRIRAAARLLA
jgi:hypothetical protein